MDNQSPGNPAKPFYLVLAVILVILAVILIAGYFRLFSQAPPSTPTPSPTPTANITGKVLNLKDGFLTVKDGDREVKIKFLPEDLAIKQFRIGVSSIGTKAEKIQLGDFVSLTATKSAEGDLWASSAVILLEEFATTSAGLN